MYQSHGTKLAYKARDGFIAAEKNTYLRALSSPRAETLNPTTRKIKVPIERGGYAQGHGTGVKLCVSRFPSPVGDHRLGSIFRMTLFAENTRLAIDGKIPNKFKTEDQDIRASETEKRNE